MDVGFCWGSCSVADENEGAVFVALAARLLNNMGRVSGYTLTMIIRASAMIVKRLLLSDGM